jgi:hypothetical protein
MTALIGAGMFGLVPHPIASFGSYRHDQREVPAPGEHGGLATRRIREVTTPEQVASPPRKLDTAPLGGHVR